MFRLNILLDLSKMAATKMLGPLLAQLLLKVLCESTRFWVVWVIQGCKGVGDLPGIRGGSGEGLQFCNNLAQLTQELRLRV